MHKILLIALGTVLLFSYCRNQNYNPLKDFINKQEKRITGEDVKLQSDTILFRPFNFHIIDSLAIINDNTGEAGYTIINLKKGAFIKKFAYSGNDSSEFDINALSINSTINNRSIFSITQLNSPFKISIFNLDSLIRNSTYKPRPIFYPIDFGFTDSYILNDSMVIGKFSYSKFDNKTFGVINLYSNKLTTGIDVPGMNKKHKLHKEDAEYYEWLNNVLANRVKYRPGSTYEFACFSHNGAVIQIFDVSENYHLKLKWEKVYYLPTFSVIKTHNFSKAHLLPDSKYGFSSLAVTKEKIYALYNGPGLDKSIDNKNKSDILLVYDWNGKALEKIKLDRKCGLISIDEDHPEILYGLYGTMNTDIVKYKL